MTICVHRGRIIIILHIFKASQCAGLLCEGIGASCEPFQLCGRVAEVWLVQMMVLVVRRLPIVI
ncbi:hypothetical protein IL54_4404 [Sphingobium sp. ba1]|nr:hypothetical protein IL54_4404 [Sphingobium sp. ba1]